MTHHLPRELENPTKAAFDDWSRNGKVARLWNCDKTLWTGADEDKWLGWLEVPDRELEQPARFEEIANEVKSKQDEHAALLGMGGSSLCPEVLSLTFDRQAGFPK